MEVVEDMEIHMVVWAAMAEVWEAWEAWADTEGMEVRSMDMVQIPPLHLHCLRMLNQWPRCVSCSHVVFSGCALYASHIVFSLFEVLERRRDRTCSNWILQQRRACNGYWSKFVTLQQNVDLVVLLTTITLNIIINKGIRKCCCCE